MDDLDLLAGARIEWLSDRLDYKGTKPRHLGRPVSFEYFDTTNPENYDSINVLGILEGVAGTNLIVSGDTYEIDRVSNLKIWRRKVA